VKWPGAVLHEVILSFSSILTLRPSDPLPFVPAGRLGSGGYGVVDKVRLKGTDDVLARKTFSSTLGYGSFQWEVEVMKKLPHHAHVIGFSGAYSRADQSGILMTPVASHNLESYLKQPPPGHHGDDRSRWLVNQFSCLVAGLKSLHDRDIRHGDIKPANFLVSGGNIMFCDFGLSQLRHFRPPSGQAAMTKMYAPPEAFCNVPREGLTSKSYDIWSLGCVFLEMATWLCGLSVAEFREF
jgi:serine/threonine protein kinase